jgi:methyl-accepting chemotaxis protein
MTKKSAATSERTPQRARGSRRPPLIWSALALAVLAASGILVLLLNRSAASETRSSFDWATHTLEVEDKLHAALAALGNAESAQRGFLLSRDTVYLTPSRQAGDTARRLLASLRTLTADNAGQQRRLDILDRLVVARLGLLGSGVALMQAGQRDSLDRLIRSGRGRALMDSIHATVRSAVANEDTLLVRRQVAVEGALSRRLRAEELIVGIALLAMGLAALVTMCAWSKAIEFEGEWMSVEEYMNRRFGIMITHGISPTELARLETEMDGAPILASATRGVTARGA